MRKFAFSILDLLYLGFTAVVVVFWLFSYRDNPYFWIAGGSLLVIFLYIFLIVKLRNNHPTAPLKWLITFYPLVYLFIIFETFFMILPYFNSMRYDAALTNIDFSIFGQHPTVWIEQFINPVFTDFFNLLYLFYFPMPLFILVYLYRHGMMRELERSVFILMVTYFGAYVLYFFVPAEGPRFFLAHEQTVPLTGIFFTKWINNLIGFLEPNKLDAFPSLHTAILLATMMITGRYNRFLFSVFIPIAVGILISLVYCRYHYVIDIIVGAAWSFVAFYVADRIYSRFAGSYVLNFYVNEEKQDA